MHCRYDPNPSQDKLIRTISISRRWSVQHLYDYALDHLQRQFDERRIHPAVALGVAREYGIPSLIEPAVRALADSKVPLASWSTDAEVISYMSVFDLGVIGRMKEKLLMARIALCTPFPAIHDDVTCYTSGRPFCSMAWRDFWVSTIVPKLLSSDGQIAHKLLWIKDTISNAKICGMADRCREWTVGEVVKKPGWLAEWNIPEGAAKILMVPEREMLTMDCAPDTLTSSPGL